MSRKKELNTKYSPEFKIAVIMDLYNDEIQSYSISLSPNLEQTREMLQVLFEKLPEDATQYSIQTKAGGTNTIRIRHYLKNTI